MSRNLRTDTDFDTLVKRLNDDRKVIQDLHRKLDHLQIELHSLYLQLPNLESALREISKERIKFIQSKYKNTAESNDGKFLK